MQTVFQVGDKVYHWKYGWGCINKFYDNRYDDCYAISVKFNDCSHRFTLDGRLWQYEPATLSFTEYDLGKGGFSQERPVPKFPEIDEGAVVYVGTYYRRAYSPYLDEGIEWKIGFYHNILNERFFFKQSTSDKVASVGVLLALENPLIHTETPIYKAEDYI